MMQEGRERLEKKQNGGISGSVIQGSVVRIDILVFFQANPHTIDTAAGLARRLHRGLKEIEQALEPLIRMGLIQRQQYNDVQLYQLKNGNLIATFFNNQREM